MSGACAPPAPFRWEWHGIVRPPYRRPRYDSDPNLGLIRTVILWISRCTSIVVRGTRQAQSSAAGCVPQSSCQLQKRTGARDSLPLRYQRTGAGLLALGPLRPIVHPHAVHRLQHAGRYAWAGGAGGGSVPLRRTGWPARPKQVVPHRNGARSSICWGAIIVDVAVETRRSGCALRRR